MDRAEKIAFLRSLSVFSVPATYGESFGLYVIESMAAGKQIPGIGGWKIGNRYIVNEGNHRMTAALELYKASGDPKHVLQLLKEGNWTNRDPGVPTWKMTED